MKLFTVKFAKNKVMMIKVKYIINVVSAAFIMFACNNKPAENKTPEIKDAGNRIPKSRPCTINVV